MATNKPVRGIAVHRSILIGSTATPLTAQEKLSADPMHTHKWTVAVRSAASNPLPTHPMDERGMPKHSSTHATPNAGAAAGTRGRDTETDYHKHVGGKDDISHFIRRVQFKLHESFPQPSRTVDRPPFQICETGWGEFEIMVKIWFVPEAGEKPIMAPHYLKLHPWPNMPLPISPPAEGTAAQPATISEAMATANGGSSTEPANSSAPRTAEPADATMNEGTEPDVQRKSDDAKDSAPSAKPDGSDAAAAAPEDGSAETEAATAGADGTATAADPTSTATTTVEPAAAPVVLPPPPPMAPVIHSWQYDEIVFPEPPETFYQTLLSHPPTPLPPGAYSAFTESKVARVRQGFRTAVGVDVDPKDVPPYPLYAPSALPYTEGISYASMQAEADRLDVARIEAVKELEKERERLIAAEKELRLVRKKADEMIGFVTRA